MRKEEKWKREECSPFYDCGQKARIGSWVNALRGHFGDLRVSQGSQSGILVQVRLDRPFRHPPPITEEHLQEHELTIVV